MSEWFKKKFPGLTSEVGEVTQREWKEAKKAYLEWKKQEMLSPENIEKHCLDKELVRKAVGKLILLNQEDPKLRKWYNVITKELGL